MSTCHACMCIPRLSSNQSLLYWALRHIFFFFLAEMLHVDRKCQYCTISEVAMYSLAMQMCWYLPSSHKPVNARRASTMAKFGISRQWSTCIEVQPKSFDSLFSKIMQTRGVWRLYPQNVWWLVGEKFHVPTEIQWCDKTSTKMRWCNFSFANSIWTFI